MKPKPGSLRSSQRLQGSFPSLQSFVAALFLLRDVSCQQGFCRLCPGYCQNPPLCCARPCSRPFPSPRWHLPVLSVPSNSHKPRLSPLSEQGRSFPFGISSLPAAPLPLLGFIYNLLVIYGFQRGAAPPLEGDEVSHSAPTEARRGDFFFGMASRELLDPVTGPSDSVFFPLGAVSEAHVTPLVLTRAELLESFFLEVVCESTEKVCECIHGFFFPPSFSPLFFF